MIYLDNSRTSQSVYIPRRSGRYGVNDLHIIVRLVLRSTVDNTTYSVSCSASMPSGAYYLVAVTLPEGVQSGTYDYSLFPTTLKPDSEPISQGVCMIWPVDEGPAGPSYQEHGGEPTFKQYENE